MRYFLALMVWATEFELAIASKAPVRNADNISQLRVSLAYWTQQRDVYEVSHV